MFSGHMVQEALEGNEDGAVHADTRGITLTPTLPRLTAPGVFSPKNMPGFAQGDFHSSSELRQVIAHLASTDAGERKVDIFLQHEEGLTLVPKGANQVQGSTLPEHLADRLPNINNTPSGPIGPPPSGGLAPVAGERAHGRGQLPMKKLGYRVVVRHKAKRALTVSQTKLSGAKLMTIVAAKSGDVEWMNQQADSSVTLRLELRPDEGNNFVPFPESTGTVVTAYQNVRQS